MTISVQPFEGQPDAWDQFALHQSGSTYCHRHAWRAVIERTFGHQCLWLGASDREGTLRGVLPLVRVRSRLFGHFLVSVPFLNYGGPLGDREAQAALAREAVGQAERDRVRLLELRSRIEQPLDLAVSHRKITVVLNLPRSSDELMKAFPSKLRSQVRRPLKEGMTFRFGADQVEPFFQVFARHMRDLGTPVLPRSFFEAAVELIPDTWVGCGYLGDRPVACGAGFLWNGELEMTWASALVESNRISANMGLYWAFMERAIGAGIARFNFGRCTPDGGTHRFKRQWGGRDEQLWWYQHSPTGRLDSTPTPDGGAFSWGPRLWKRLPLSVANALGPRIVRSIP